jgi:hypothetical protein
VKGEDKIFMISTIMAIIGNQHTMAQFLLNKDNVDRLLAIRNELGRDAFEAEIIKLKEVIK